jgi:hypothetical protein
MSKQITYIIGLQDSVFKNDTRCPNYIRAICERPNLDYDYLFVFKVEELILILPLEEMWVRYHAKRYGHLGGNFHSRIERMLRYLLRVY